MSYYQEELYTTKFKVKNPEKFQEDFKNRVEGERKDLIVAVDGFQIVGTNLYVISEGAHHEDVADFIHQHILEGSHTFITRVTICSRDVPAASITLVTDLAINYADLEDLEKTLLETIVPRKLIARWDFFNHGVQQWVKKDEVVILQYKNCNEELEVKIASGHTIPYTEENYNECT